MIYESVGPCACYVIAREEDDEGSFLLVSDLQIVCRKGGCDNKNKELTQFSSKSAPPFGPLLVSLGAFFRSVDESVIVWSIVWP
jgi:hypothetical protein